MCIKRQIAATLLLCGVCMPLFRSKAEQSHSFSIVLPNTLTVSKHGAQVELSVGMPLFRSKAEQSHSLSIVLPNNLCFSRLTEHMQAPVPLQGGTIAQPQHRPA